MSVLDVSSVFSKPTKKKLFDFIFGCVVSGEAEYASVISARALSLAVFNASGD